MRRTTLVLLFLIVAPLLYAQNEKADLAFCQYTTEQGKAQRDLLRSPSVTLGPIQPSTGTPPQLVIGLTNSLRDDRKASLTMKLANSTCNQYRATSEAQLHLTYALPQIEKDVLNNRLRLIDETSRRLDDLIAQNRQKVQTQNLTEPAVYPLESARVRLDENRTATLTGIASPYVPKLTETPLKVLIGQKQVSVDAATKATVKLEKQEAWDVQLGAGAHRRLPSTLQDASTSTWGAYGFFNVYYNLGHRAISHHFDQSVTAYDEFKRTQFDDVTQQAAFLKKQMEDTIVIQQSQLASMEVHMRELSEQLKALQDVDTNNAIAFRNTLLSDQLLLNVSLSDARFRIERLQLYLTNNF